MDTASNTPAHEPPPPAIAGYRLLRRIGKGGMGEVWLAEQTALHRQVALKLLEPRQALSPTAVERFAREARALATLDHPNVVRVLEAGESNGVRFLAMELVEGRGLDELLGAAPLPVPDVVRWGRDVARALAAAHAAAIVHRDVKPHNVRVRPDGSAVLLDFGLARDLEEPGLTRAGSFQGSPLYAAPEQITDKLGPVGPRADLFALGVTLHECLAGAPVFARPTVEDILRAVLFDEPPPLPPRVPRDVATVVGKAMAKRPEDRYASATELTDELDAILALQPVRARPPALRQRLASWCRRHPVAAAVTAALLVAGLALAVALPVQRAIATAERRARVNELLGTARHATLELEASSRAVGRLAATVLPEREATFRNHTSDDAEQSLAAREAELAVLRRQADAALLRAQESLATARALVAAGREVDATEAALLVTRWSLCDARREPELAADLARRAVMLDPALASTLQARGELTIETEPANATLDLLRYETHATEPRLVAVPFPSALLPGTPLALAPGSYLVLVRAAGHEPQRLPVLVERGARRALRLMLERAGTSPSGFVRIVNVEGEPFWMQVHEVTTGDYLEFLNAPDTQEAIERASEAILYPRYIDEGRSESSLPRQPDGTFALPASMSLLTPVHSIAFDDAVAYAAWRSKQAEARREPWRFELPSDAEWRLAAGGGDGRRFVYGDRFRPHWQSSLFAHREADDLDPVGAFPLDESPWGVRDLAGSVSEWGRDWFRQAHGERIVLGGNWTQSRATDFAIGRRGGRPAWATFPDTGFRLMARRKAR